MPDERLETIAIPLADEELIVSKREVETGRVRVRTLVDTHEELVRDELVRASVDVERVAFDTVIEKVPSPRTEGDTLILPVIEEVLYVRKALVLKEEIHLHRRISTEMVEQPVAVRSQRAVVEREELSGDSDQRASRE